MSVIVHHGDSRAVLKGVASASIDACVTDPPYALVSITKRWNKPGMKPPGPSAGRPEDKQWERGDGSGSGVYKRATSGFMGQAWDTGETAFDPAFWAEVLRVLKPGAHLLAFSGTRTYHRMTCAIEDAGFEIRDQIGWLYGSGFPKSHDVAKAIDKAAGEWRGRAGRAGRAGHSFGQEYERNDKGDPITDQAKEWQGWGTALKPAWEPIVVARKPLIGTVAANVMKHGTGALNIDGCRVATEDGYQENAVTQGINTAQTSYAPASARRTFEPSTSGRWPANVVHDGSEEVLAGFPETGAASGKERRNGEFKSVAKGRDLPHSTFGHEDNGGSAARFFYGSKADKGDRLGSKHPTVKPVDLMRWLVRLVTPPGGTVLDPFAGSGSTGMACLAEGFSAVLIEREAQFVADIRRRIDHVSGADAPLFAGRGGT